MNFTVGTIAIKQGDSWTGVFHDSTCPTVFGNTLWKKLQEQFKNLDNFAKELLKYDSWEGYLNEGYCLYCGKFNKSKAYDINGGLFMKCLSDALAPDPFCKEHKHKKNEPEILSCNEKKDSLFIEWVYLLDIERFELEIFKTVIDKEKNIGFPKGNLYIGGLNQSPFEYRYCSIGLFNLFSNEPNWIDVENKGKKIELYYNKKFANIIARH